MFLLYNVAYILFALCYLPVFLLRGKYHQGFMMRLGLFPQQIIDALQQKPVIWLHTVSVGETQAAAYLIKNLKREYRDCCIAISTVTKTGHRLAQKLIGEEDVAIYSPLDVSFIVKKVVNIIKPKFCIIAETEIWPNLILHLNKRRIPIILVNGRISPRSFRGYRLICRFLKTILHKFDLFCMQNAQDAQRIIALGAEDHKVKITGNMKFDIQVSDLRPQAASIGLQRGQRLFIAGSTHRGEEEIILNVYNELIRIHPNLRLLIAPRHIERAKEIERLVDRFGLKSQRISQLNLNDSRFTIHDSPILLLDTIGQLKSLYALADIVFVGGSLVSHGGQNPIEPAVFSKAIIFGPYMFNFTNIADLFMNNQAALTVKDEQELKSACVKLLNEFQVTEDLGERARKIVEKNSGATLRNIELIKNL